MIIRRRGTYSVATTPAPTLYIASPSASFSLSEGASLTVIGYCTNALTVDVYYRVDGGSWTLVGTDLDTTDDAFAAGKTLASGDVGAVDLKAIAHGPGGDTESAIVSGTVVALPTVAITAPSASSLWDKVTDVSIAVAGTCGGAVSVELLVSVDGGAFGSWGSDSSVGSGAWDVTRTIQAADVGDTVVLKARATNSAGGYTDSATVTIEVIDIGNMAASYFWLAPGKVEAAATRVADPTIPGGGWSGTNWSGSGLGPYTHTAGSTAVLTNACLTQYLRYLVTYTISGRTAGTLTGPGGTSRNADGTYTGELTASSTACAFTPSSDFNGSVTIVSIACLSISALAATSGALAGFAQATASYQPWIGQSALNGCKPLQSSVDRMVSSSAWDLSASTSVTIITATRNSGSGTYVLIEQSASAATNDGFALYTGADKMVAAMNGSTGGFTAYTTTATVPLDNATIVGAVATLGSPITFTTNGANEPATRTSGSDDSSGYYANQTVYLLYRSAGTTHYEWPGEVFGLYIGGSDVGSTNRSRIRRYCGQSRLLNISTT